MRVRHRPPSIFNMSMVDVLCCALGCVLLMWLWHMLKAQDSEAQKKQQTETINELLTTVTQNSTEKQHLRQALEDLLAGSSRDKSALDEEVARQRARVVALEARVTEAAINQATTSRDLDDLRALLTRERARSADLEKEKTALQARVQSLQTLADRVPDLEKERVTLLGRIQALQVVADRVPDLARDKTTLQALADRVPILEKDLAFARDTEKRTEQTLTRTTQTLAAREADLADLARRIQALAVDKTTLEKTLATRAEELRVRSEELRATQTNLTANRTTLTGNEKKLADALARARELETELTGSVRALVTAQEDKKKLEAALALAKTNSDTRFAGIALTGKRVVFLVDTSLSMIETADGKAAPEKWEGVVDNVLRVMRSLPELESYQLVTFSVDATYPLGQSGQWLRYDSKNSPDLIKRTLLDPRNKPDGGTNMYAGFDQAFKLRPEHLDSVYLFSDGLPSRGFGVDPARLVTLPQTERARLLGDHVRKTLRDEWNKPLPNLPRVKIHSIGFYYDSPDVGAFLWALSREHDGSFVGMSRP